MDQEFRNKIKTIQKDHEAKIDSLQVRLKTYQKEVAVLSKGKLKAASSSNAAPTASATVSSNRSGAGGGSGSGSGSESSGNWRNIVRICRPN